MQRSRDLVYFILTLGRSLEKECGARHARLLSLADQTDIEDLYRTYISDLDTKCSALLTHISLMIALLGILYSSFANDLLPFDKTVILVEVILYLFLTALTLRCLRTSAIDSIEVAAKHYDDAGQRQRFVGFCNDYTYRSYLYNFCNQKAAILTAVLIGAFLISITLHLKTRDSGANMPATRTLQP
jgi:hypothetical protein